jgi:hypothetical protein
MRRRVGWVLWRLLSSGDARQSRQRVGNQEFQDGRSSADKDRPHTGFGALRWKTDGDKRPVPFRL